MHIKLVNVLTVVTLTTVVLIQRSLWLLIPWQDKSRNHNNFFFGRPELSLLLLSIFFSIKKYSWLFILVTWEPWLLEYFWKCWFALSDDHDGVRRLQWWWWKSKEQRRGWWPIKDRWVLGPVSCINYIIISKTGAQECKHTK